MVVAQYFHLPIDLASKELSICPTLIKKICRKNGVSRWPYRRVSEVISHCSFAYLAVTQACCNLQLQGMEKLITKLDELLTSDCEKVPKHTRNSIRGQLAAMKAERDRLCRRK